MYHQVTTIMLNFTIHRIPKELISKNRVAGEYLSSYFLNFAGVVIHCDMTTV